MHQFQILIFPRGDFFPQEFFLSKSPRGFMENFETLIPHQFTLK